jgi:uncharacterized lipoprotein YajG
MSRRHLSLLVVAIASLVVSACSAAPTGPSMSAPAAAPAHDDAPAPSDSTGRIGTTGSNG